MYTFFHDNYSGVIENKLPKDYDGYCAGTRLSKVFMKRFGMDRPEDAEAVRQRLSMLIQSNKITGKLCISIHPLDFLSASENNHSWRSCHAMDGEYRVGNVSYMMDNCTIMAYLKSNGPDVKLPNFPDDVFWNDKKWRCYFYVDRVNEIIYAAKQYPFFSEKALDIIADIIKTKFAFFWSEEKKESLLNNVRRTWYWSDRENITWANYATEAFGFCTFEPTGLKGDVNINGHVWNFENTKIIVGAGPKRRIVPITNYIETDKDACCYNDVIQSHSYSPWTMSYNHNGYAYIPDKVETKLIVGTRVPCVCCGNRFTADSDIFVCNYCRVDDKECERCGCIEPANEMYYDEDTNSWFCSCCWEDLHETNKVNKPYLEPAYPWE